MSQTPQQLPKKEISNPLIIQLRQVKCCSRHQGILENFQKHNSNWGKWMDTAIYWANECDECCAILVECKLLDRS